MNWRRIRHLLWALIVPLAFGMVVCMPGCEEESGLEEAGEEIDEGLEDLGDEID